MEVFLVKDSIIFLERLVNEVLTNFSDTRMFCAKGSNSSEFLKCSSRKETFIITHYVSHNFTEYVIGNQTWKKEC